jgi:hypothetical protein
LKKNQFFKIITGRYSIKSFGGYLFYKLISRDVFNALVVQKLDKIKDDGTVLNKDKKFDVLSKINF